MDNINLVPVHDELTDYLTVLQLPKERLTMLSLPTRLRNLHVLIIYLFGQDHAGMNALVKLQCQMRNLKVTAVSQNVPRSCPGEVIF